MTTPVLLGIDLGTTMMKASVFHAQTGALIAHGEQRLPVRNLPNGGHEIDLPRVDSALRVLLKKFRSYQNNFWNSLAGIGIASQAGSTIIAERENGRALTPMILWNDGRFHSHTQRIAEKLSLARIRKFTLNHWIPAGLGRLLHWKETRPDLFHEGNIHCGAGDYLFFQLTGTWRQDAGSALQIGSYDAAKQKLSSTLFDGIDVPLSFVAPLREGHSVQPLSREGARRFHLPEGVPVAGPYFDQEAGYLSCATSSCQPLYLSLGTAWVGNFMLPSGWNGGSPTQLAVPSSSGKGKLIVQPLLTGNPTWEWALQQFVHKQLDKALQKAETIFNESVLPQTPVTALPWFSQPNPLLADTYGAGALIGLCEQTPTEDQLRALAAGMVFELARIFYEVREQKIIDRIVLSGGASRGTQFCQLLAALFEPLSIYQQTRGNGSTAWGSLTAFHPRTYPRNGEPIRKSDKPFIAETRKHFDRYLQIFHSLYGNVSMGKAFTVTRKAS